MPAKGLSDAGQKTTLGPCADNTEPQTNRQPKTLKQKNCKLPKIPKPLPYVPLGLCIDERRTTTACHARNKRSWEFRA